MVNVKSSKLMFRVLARTTSGDELDRLPVMVSGLRYWHTHGQRLVAILILLPANCLNRHTVRNAFNLIQTSKKL